MKSFLSKIFFLFTLLSFSQQNTEIFLFDIDRGKLLIELTNFKNISNNEGYDNQPSFWDNRIILYSGTRNGQTDIIKYNIVDGSKEWLSNTEGGEYSPLRIPMQDAFSAIRLDLDGKQLLYHYDLNTGRNTSLIDTLVVGYHVWGEKDTVFSSVLENEIMSLYKTDIRLQNNNKLEQNVGRSLHIIPQAKYSFGPSIKGRISYIDKNTIPWQIMSFNLNNGLKNKVTTMLSDVEDMVWLDDRTILSGKDTKLYKYMTNFKSDWVEIADLKKYGITNITRLAVSPDGKKLAVVGELQHPGPEKKETQLIEVLKTQESITIDGKADEPIWNKATWHPIDQRWLGQPYTTEDFEGQYKLCWSEDALYVLVEIKDDVLYDQYQDPLKLWWDDDCVEVFIDEDNSGGGHQYNHNAFAYHVAMDGNVVDMSTEKTGKLYNSHVTSKNSISGNTTIWELKISIFDDTYNDNHDDKNKPVKLQSNKKIGFAIAYCDNDSSLERENFIGSIPVEGEDKNKGWIDANIFGTLILTE